MVRRIQGELRQGALEPDSAREYLITLSALYGNCLQEIREADAAYAVVLLAHLDSSEKANRAKIRAETSDREVPPTVVMESRGLPQPWDCDRGEQQRWRAES